MAGILRAGRAGRGCAGRIKEGCTETLTSIIGAVGAAVAQLIAVVNLVLVPAGGVAQNPIALLLWTFLVLSLLAAVWTFIRSLIRRRAPATDAGPARPTADNPAPRRRQRTRTRAARTEPERLSLWTRVFLRLRMVSFTIDEFRGLSKADRARYAGDKRYDPRYFGAATDAERRAFERDRQRRVHAHLARHGWTDAEEPAAEPRRRRPLPDWMQPGQAQPTASASVSKDGIDPLTGRYNAEWARLSHPDYEVPPENPAYVALFDLPEQRSQG